MSPLTLLLLGDSLIDFGNWSARLSDYYVVSQGVPGERTEELLRRLPRSMPEPPPAAIILMTGTNDLFWGNHDFPDTIEQILRTLRQSHPDTTCIITSLPPFRVPGFRNAVQLANKRLKTIAGQAGCLYCDIHSLFEQSADDLFSFDGVHLSEAGYRLWAETLKNILEHLEIKSA